MQTATLNIEPMSCQNCVAHVTAALAAVPGVRVENVEIGAATVSFDPATVSETQITDAVAQAGYRAAWEGTSNSS